MISLGPSVSRIDGVTVRQRHAFTDDRGTFIQAQGDGSLHLTSDVNVAISPRAGTLRGLHYQTRLAQAKHVQVIRGRIFDVAVDMRPRSKTLRHMACWELSADDGLVLYLPAGLAHGYLTLEPDTIVLYTTSQPYIAEAQAGVRWDDPSLDIPWPMLPMVISERDMAWPLLGTNIDESDRKA